MCSKNICGKHTVETSLKVPKACAEMNTVNDITKTVLTILIILCFTEYFLIVHDAHKYKVKLRSSHGNKLFSLLDYTTSLVFDCCTILRHWHRIQSNCTSFWGYYNGRCLEIETSWGGTAAWIPQKRRKDSWLVLLYKGLKGKARWHTLFKF